ncbi:START domain-containing protein [Aliiglaciecola sp. CAU 1673]|uniref:START domain-containing protein n=1 Tax=Aliiglaciecola sp. CAU 1673 TaxID=3032595 RepID=UPI0023DCB89A|nr:START domain-containing protein [Aliiglaciecola sp. CAU 1673]MDF2177600.1 START domain-containing protein [Aliiglaciecola sp. CAU 1673]
MQFLILLVLASLMPSMAFADCVAGFDGWKQAKKAQGVTVSKRQLANGQLEVCASTAVRTQLSAFILLLRDTEHAPQWIANAHRVTLLERPAHNVDVVHSIFDSPWPVQDRDLVTRSQYQQDADSLVLTLQVHSVPDALPPSPNTVRMDNVRGVWELTPLQEGWVAIRYQGEGDPGGNIPNWLAQQILVSSTFETFANLKKMLPLPQYQNKPFRDIRELVINTQNSAAIP